MPRKLSSLKEFYHCQKGATAIEYALIATLISIAIVGAVKALGISVTGIYDSIKTSVQGDSPAA